MQSLIRNCHEIMGCMPIQGKEGYLVSITFPHFTPVIVFHVRCTDIYYTHIPYIQINIIDHIASGQVDLQLTRLDGQVLEKYQKYWNILPHMINFEVLL